MFNTLNHQQQMTSFSTAIFEPLYSNSNAYKLPKFGFACRRNKDLKLEGDSLKSFREEVTTPNNQPKQHVKSFLTLIILPTKSYQFTTYITTQTEDGVYCP